MTAPQPVVEVIDYGGGNLGSLLRAFDRLQVPYVRCAGNANNSFPSGKAPLVLPGVGAFGALMRQLKNRELTEPIQTVIRQGLPFLGVCVGLQVLFEGSEESPGEAGLAILPGAIKRFTAGKVPQIGWNWVESKQQHWPNGYVYYVNSYYAPLDVTRESVLFSSEYEQQAFCGAVHQANVTAFQFHPEKSGAFGHDLLAHWYATSVRKQAQ